MTNLMLFTDASVDCKSRVGYGAYLMVSDATLELTVLKEKIILRHFENTSSTTLELQTLLCALDDIAVVNYQTDMTVTIYTDSQNIITLPARRVGFEKNNYYSRNGKRLNHCELYQQFYRATERLHCHFVKIIGHQTKHKKDHIDEMFSLVDKASRAALRESVIQQQ